MEIAQYIDHTILKPSTTYEDIKKLCTEAMEYNFAAVCVPGYFVKTAKGLLAGTGVKVATVVGFPFGYSTRGAKMEEIMQGFGDGADEFDIVHNITALKDGNYDLLVDEIRQCTDWIQNKNNFFEFAPKIIKVIIESGILTDDEIVKCCKLYAPLGIDFMKTSTGYAEVGATVKAVQLMRKNLPETIQIKASGGIRSFAFAKELIDAGATRIGCSASVQIVKESKEALSL